MNNLIPKPEDYNNHQMPSPSFRSRSFLSIICLPELTGQPLNDVAWGYIHALRPSCVRVSTGRLKCDAYCWRVTILIDAETKLITKITQEAEVGLPDGIGNGHELNCALAAQKRG